MSILYVLYKRIYQILAISHVEYWTFRCTKWIEGGEARIGNFRLEISIWLVISIRLDHVDLQFSSWNFHTAGYFHTDWFNWPVFHLFMGGGNTSTVYVPIEARYPIEARPPFREQKLNANVYICNKMESLSNQNDI